MPGDYMAFAVCECGVFLNQHESSDKAFAQADIQHPSYKKIYGEHVKGDYQFKWVARPEQHKELHAILAKSKDGSLRELFTS